MWRTIERELVDIFRAEGLDLDINDAADKVVKDGDLTIINITYLAQELFNRGIRPAKVTL